MKRIAIIVIILALVIPNLVLASWWNPFSWSIFHRTDTKTEVLENRVNELERKLEKIATSTPTTTEKSQDKTLPSTKNNTTQISDKKTYIKLSNLNNFIDVIIEGNRNNINYVNEIQKAIDYYDDDYNKGKTLSITARNSTTEPVYINVWDLIISYWDEGLKKNNETRNTFLMFNQSTKNEIISALQREKEDNILAEPVSSEVYLAHYDKLKLKLESIEKNKKLFSDIYNAFESQAKKFHSEIGSYMLAEAKKELDYSASAVREMNEINSARSVVPTYQPISYPQIQMPKTTYCNMSGGLGGNYTIICN